MRKERQQVGTTVRRDTLPRYGGQWQRSTHLPVVAARSLTLRLARQAAKASLPVRIDLTQHVSALPV
eukprot:362192-Chlamydomonas_euryale.AAC.3